MVATRPFLVVNDRPYYCVKCAGNLRIEMVRRSSRGEVSSEPVEVTLTTAVWAFWNCGDEEGKALTVGEKVHPTEGHMWEVKYSMDNTVEWLQDRFVRARGGPAKPPSEKQPAKKKAKKTEVPKANVVPKKTKKGKNKPDEAQDDDEEEAKQVEPPASSPAQKEPATMKEPAPEMEVETHGTKKEPFLMHPEGYHVVPLAQAHALSTIMECEDDFQARVKGNRRKLQSQALSCMVSPERGFDVISPFYDILKRGHKLVEDDDTSRMRMLNLLDDYGLSFKVTHINAETSGTACKWTFANVMTRDCTGSTQVRMHAAFSP